MKICFLCHNNLFSRARGGETSTRIILEYLADCGYDCYAIMPKCGPQDSYHPKFNVICCGDNDDIGSRVLAIKPDILLSWGSAISFGAALKEHLKIPHIPFIRTWRDMSRYPNIIENLRKADAVFVNCKEGQRRLKIFYSIEALVSYVPVSLKRDLDVRPRFITVIDKDDMFDIHWDIIVNMEDEEFVVVDDRTKEVVRGNNFSVLPWQDDMDKIWEQTKIFLLPTGKTGRRLALGTGRAMIKAMANGIPTIVEDGCGAEELCNIVVPADAPWHDWITKITAICFDYDTASTEARKTIFERYSPESELSKIKIAIQEILNRKRALVYVSDGIGNMLEATHAIQAIRTIGYKTDALAQPSEYSSVEMLENMDVFGKVVPFGQNVTGKYDKRIQLTSFGGTFSFGSDSIAGVRDHERNEREWSMDIARQLGYAGKVPKASTSCSNRFFDIPRYTVAMPIDASSKAWIMKRYSRYDKLAEFFKSVMLLGSKPYLVPDYQFGDNATDFVGKLSLLDSFALIKQCAVFVGHDGGLAHAAAALGIPTFVIFGGTCAIKNLPAGAVKLERPDPLDCQPCQHTERFMQCDNFKCLDEFEPADIIAQVRDWCEKNNQSLLEIFK